MTHDCTDATRCGQCEYDERTVVCEVCGDRYDPAEGCAHDGHRYCAACFAHYCGECRDDLRDAMRAEARD